MVKDASTYTGIDYLELVLGVTKPTLNTLSKKCREYGLGISIYAGFREPIGFMGMRVNSDITEICISTGDSSGASRTEPLQYDDDFELSEQNGRMLWDMAHFIQGHKK